MWNQRDRLLVERSGAADWLGLRTFSPQAYRTRKGDILLSLESAKPKAWDDDDIAEDEDEDEEDDDEDELLPDDDADDLEDDEDDDDADDEDE